MTTPEMEGGLGTNVMEGLIVCLLGKKPEDVTDEINDMLDRLNLSRDEVLNPPP